MAILLLVLLSVEGGYRLGKYQRSRSEEEKEAPVGAMVGATPGLLAFMLAFTFGLAATRFDTRRQVLLDEANAIGTTYLRAGMLPERRYFTVDHRRPKSRHSRQPLAAVWHASAMIACRVERPYDMIIRIGQYRLHFPPLSPDQGNMAR
jgi:hypothetical protein